MSRPKIVLAAIMLLLAGSILSACGDKTTAQPATGDSTSSITTWVSNIGKVETTQWATTPAGLDGERSTSTKQSPYNLLAVAIVSEQDAARFTTSYTLSATDEIPTLSGKLGTLVTKTPHWKRSDDLSAALSQGNFKGSAFFDADNRAVILEGTITK